MYTSGIWKHCARLVATRTFGQVDSSTKADMPWPTNAICSSSKAVSSVGAAFLEHLELCLFNDKGEGGVHIVEGDALEDALLQGGFSAVQVDRLLLLAAGKVGHRLKAPEKVDNRKGGVLREKLHQLKEHHQVVGNDDVRRAGPHATDNPVRHVARLQEGHQVRFAAVEHAGGDEEGLDDAGVDEAGQARLGQFHAKRQVKADVGELRGAVVGQLGAGQMAGHRGDGDDVPAAALDHRGEEGLDGEEVREGVHVKGELNLGVRGVEQLRAADHAGVVYQNVHRAEDGIGLELLGALVDRLAVRQVDGGRLQVLVVIGEDHQAFRLGLGHRFREARLVDVPQHHPAAQPEEAKGHQLADAAAAPRYQHPLTADVRPLEPFRDEEVHQAEEEVVEEGGDGVQARRGSPEREAAGDHCGGGGGGGELRG
ncbi:hypothetical protein TYRP_011657 [Tyrophagus putrescentiae]|nr:hypothetical protein TYRP_011657 [Tyrophagus putrescentiae]